MSGTLLSVVGVAKRAGLSPRAWIMAIYDDGILLARRPWRDVLSGFNYEGAFTARDDADVEQYKQAELWERCSDREQLLARRSSRFIGPAEVFNATLSQRHLGELGLTLRLTDGSDVELGWAPGWGGSDPAFDEAEAALRKLLGSKLRT